MPVIVAVFIQKTPIASETERQRFTNFQNLDISTCNISFIAPDTFKTQKETLKILNLSKNSLKSLPTEILTELPALEELDISKNPLICDDAIASCELLLHFFVELDALVVSTVDERYKSSAKEGKDFLLSNGNETLCARPWTLKGQPVFEVDSTKLVVRERERSGYQGKSGMFRAMTRAWTRQPCRRWQRQVRMRRMRLPLLSKL